MQIDKMPAGREMDALVAEAVMEWKVFYGSYNGYDLLDNEVAQGFPPTGDLKGIPYEIPQYSANIAKAWEVVKKIKRTHYWGYGDFHLIWGNFGESGTPKGPGGQVCCPNKLAWLCAVETEQKSLSSYADTASLAICRAALKVMGVKK